MSMGLNLHSLSPRRKPKVFRLVLFIFNAEDEGKIADAKGGQASEFSHYTSKLTIEDFDLLKVRILSHVSLLHFLNGGN